MPADLESGTLLANLREQLIRRITPASNQIAHGDEMVAGNPVHYDKAGQSAWRCIAAALLAAGVPEPRRVLDLPCGHGRVMRVLKSALPDAEFTACDLLRDGVEFCTSAFGATGVHSQPDLEQVRFDTPFDLVWSGSLLTHLDRPGWLAFFRLLHRALAPEGVAVVTLHGRWVAHRMTQGYRYGLTDERVAAVLAKYEATGFGYATYQDSRDYGVSLSAPHWILREMHTWQQLRIVGFAERQWDNHQDVLAVQRIG
ncbi:MAG: class I SAM-dependent methyltransferase [bacterium]|nr:class I SAM-dependent methyltransferase [bacterium]